MLASPNFPPPVPLVRTHCDELIASSRAAFEYASQWEEQSQRQLQEEAVAQQALREEMAAARMAAILARRAGGRQAATRAGVHLDRVGIPHPGSAGDIVSDMSLSLCADRIYGLIGRNGSGKSTLLRALASYKLPDIQVSILLCYVELYCCYFGIDHDINVYCLYSI